MSKGADLEETKSAESAVFLGILPLFLRRELVNDWSFRHKIGFDAEEFVTYGPQIKFARSSFFEKVNEAFSGRCHETRIVDQAQHTWDLCREEISNNRIILKISNDEESFFAGEFFVFLPDVTERLREFGVALREHGFSPTGLGKWRPLLQERPLTSEELEEFSQDIKKTPFAFLSAFRRKIVTSNVSAEDMVPNDPEYFENLCGKGDASNLTDLVAEIIPKVVSDYMAWDNDEGPRMALSLCSHPLISHQIEKSRINDQQLVNLAEWVRDQGDIFSKVGFVEVALPAMQSLPDLEKPLVQIVQQIISLDPEDESGPLQLMMSFIALAESEVSRTRVLNHWPPFRRRLATFSHAALLAREAVGRIDVAHLSAWIIENHGHRFYLQNLIDLHDEPRWLPDYASPSQLKQELLGRLYNTVGKAVDGLPEGPFRDTLDPQNSESEFNKIRTIKSMFPGPLEGHDSSLRNPIPPELEEALDRNLSEKKLTVQSIAALINISGLFQVESKKAERAVAVIRASNFRFAEQMNDVERASLIHGLAEAASRLRSESLAKSVRAMSRVYREEAVEENQHSDEMIVSLLAAGAFEEFNAWKEFLGEWINELCFNVNRGTEGDLRASVELICSIEPRLRSKIGAGLAALELSQK